MVVVLSSAGLVASTTAAVPIEAAPVLLSEADVATAPAAAICDGLVRVTWMLDAAWAVG